MTDLRITIKNTSETGGTFLTPFWFGFHDGEFDLFEGGEAASAGLEQLAEDGAADTLGVELLEADADGQGFVVTGAAGPIATQEVTSTIVTVDGASNGEVSFAAMLLPSNDAFVGNGDSIDLFSARGRFKGEVTISFSGEDVYDAGTEVNTELDAAFLNQTAPNTGIDENGVVRLHPGFNGSEGNPGGEGEQLILGGTNAFGEFIDPVAADFTLPGSEIAEIHINTVRTVEGTDGRNVIIGRRDDDLVSAGDGNDRVFGKRGWDEIDGGDGDDFLSGGRGDDQIMGGRGNDFLVGGRGNDLFYYADGDGDDIIKGFGRRTEDDRLVLDVEGIDSFEALLDTAYETRRGVEFDFGKEGSIFLVGQSVENLDAEDFSFV